MKSRYILLVLTTLFSTSIGAADDIHAKASVMLDEALADRNPDTRKQAVAALSLLTSRGPYLTRLLSMLKDKDAEVRMAAVGSLSEMRSKTATEALRSALNDEVPEVSFAAAKSLYAQRDPLGKQALMAVLEGETQASSGFLSRQKREALRMMRTPRTALLFAARQGAGFAPIPGLGGGIASMQAILTDPDVSGRAAAALLLAQRNDSETLGALTQALTSGDSSLRAAAVHSLALTDRTAFRKAIAPLLSDDKDKVRLRAAAAYLRLSPGQGRPVSRTPAATKQ